MSSKSTYNDRDWIKSKRLGGLAQDAHVTAAKLGGGIHGMSNSTEQFTPHGADLFGNPIVKNVGTGTIAGRFLTPPFTVLSARDGDWQERKRAWIGLGIRSEIGRGANTLGLSAEAEAEAYRNGEGAYKKANHAAPGGSAMPAMDYSNRERGSGSGSGSAIVGTSANCGYAKTYNSGSPGSLGRAYRETAPGLTCVGGNRNYEDLDEVSRKILSANESGTSIFDPVLTELCYRWFSPAAGMILDPFAGGSVRGIVAGLLGRSYHGIELRREQVDANREQAGEICADAPVAWVCGDSIDELDNAPDADFIFSCPPYGDLERYSDDSRDLSTMEFHTFAAQYKRIILKAVKRLKPNRFACFVVGNYRDKRTGNYRDLVGETIRGFEDAGCGYYNEAILVTSVGSLPIRVGKQFAASRKLGKTHQNILVFVKGDAKQAAGACAPMA